MAAPRIFRAHIASYYVNAMPQAVSYARRLLREARDAEEVAPVAIDRPVGAAQAVQHRGQSAPRRRLAPERVEELP